MKAVRIHAFGGPETLRYEDAPLPEPAAGEVRIRVRATGLNPVDWKIREGYLHERIPHRLPLILGWDVAGDVEALGPGVTQVAVGDAVYAMTDIRRDGAYAEYVVVAAALVAPLPASLSYQTAATVPLVAQTAWQALYEMVSLQAGQRVLIHGAAGGLGSMAVQLAKRKGTAVVATAAAKDVEYVQQLGAEQVIDYQSQVFEKLAGDVDVVLDTVGGQVQERSWQVLRPGGTLLSAVQPPSAEAAATARAEGLMIHVQPSGERLRLLSTLLDKGQLHTRIGQVFPLHEAAQAHEQLQHGKAARGKVVLQVA
ncbi:NADP-dependent oxidoreductase [Hymenobacter weizhouensis]|uniref:NADP-dependent oxidoreductase n=1 Tax=Hymenobacter sp. YIM 151500-1 TaxID=2987689 RepID=UPI0022278C5F|nr:NADP-dependent oxidoreductase [Hymenobacter sp. YIM 151500-1]UYZ64482.1 NADP-dependent oxidoreductase [Hymenobacter sp. YIM 151500-1]